MCQYFIVRYTGDGVTDVTAAAAACQPASLLLLLLFTLTAGLFAWHFYLLVAITLLFLVWFAFQCRNVCVVSWWVFSLFIIRSGVIHIHSVIHSIHSFGGAQRWVLLATCRINHTPERTKCRIKHCKAAKIVAQWGLKKGTKLCITNINENINF